MALRSFKTKISWLFFDVQMNQEMKNIFKLHI